MAKAKRLSAHKVQEARAGWWEYHYGMRQLAKALDEETLRKYQALQGMYDPPIMSVFGGVSISYITPEKIEKCANLGFNVELLCPWYLSDAGWKTFTELWEKLPEPIDLYETFPKVDEVSFSGMTLRSYSDQDLSPSEREDEGWLDEFSSGVKVIAAASRIPKSML